MRPDIVNLRQFYSSQLGRKVKRRLRQLIRDLWPEGEGLHVVGIGYANQLLPLPRMAHYKNARIVALMPVAQGAIYWPVDDANHSVLADEMRPPFAPNSVHRILMVHGFEYASAPDELLNIWWQLLAPGGKLILIIPNRRGLWARFGATPFATGTPYTLSALKPLLNATNFTLSDARSALFYPPTAHPFWLQFFRPVEMFLGLIFPGMGGVLVVEAEKQIYAGVREAVVAAKPATSWAPAPVLSSPRDS